MVLANYSAARGRRRGLPLPLVQKGSQCPPTGLETLLQGVLSLRAIPVSQKGLLAERH